MADVAQFGQIQDNQNQFSDDNLRLGRENINLQFTPLQGAMAAFASPNLTQAVGEKVRMSMLGMSPEKKLTPTEIKDKYGLDTDDDLNEAQVELLNSAKDRENRINSVLSNIDPYAFGNTALPIVGGLASGILDPIALGIGFAVDRGFSAISRSVFNTAKVVNSMARVGLGVSRGAAAGVTEGLIDDYAMKSHAEEFDLQYTDADSFMNIGLSTVAGGIFGGLGAGLGIKNNRKFRKAQEAMNSFENGRQPKDFTRLSYDKDNYGRYNSGRDANPSPGDTASGKFYSAHVANGKEFGFDTQQSFDTNFGEGVIFTTNKDFAHNASTSSIEGNAGQLVEVEIGELNLLNLDRPMPDSVKQAIKDSLLGSGIGNDIIKDALDKTPDTRTFLDTIGRVAELEGKPELQTKINKALEDGGFDGYSFGHKDSNGARVGTREDFGAFVFNKDKVTAKGFEETDSQFGFKPSVEDEIRQGVDYYQSREAVLEYNAADFAEFDKLDPMPKIPTLDEQIADLQANFRDLEVEDLDYQLNNLDESTTGLSNTMKKLQEEIASNPQDLVQQAAKAATFCVRNN